MSGLVVFDISLSLDGFMRGSNPRSDNVLGDGGEQLHAWCGDHATDADRKLLEDGIGGAGAVISGRRTYDDSLPSWGADGPTGPVRLPIFVVSHSTPDEQPVGGVYQFERNIESALKAAKAAADGKDVCIMGGANVGQQFIRAGLVDELSLHIAPVLLGGGTRMFEDVTGKYLNLTIKSVVHSPGATHVRYALAR
jgi:dihydrofolate reductase